MARTKRAVASPKQRGVPLDLAGLRARAKDLDVRQRETVAMTIRIHPSLYAHLVETAERQNTRLKDLVPRALTAGLDHIGDFVSPYDETSPLKKREYRPHEGFNRGRSAYEDIVGQQAPVVAGETGDLADALNDPLIAATLGMGQRMGAPRPMAGARKPVPIPSTLDDDEPETTAPEEIE